MGYMITFGLAAMTALYALIIVRCLKQQEW
jgi:hypothetical protein